MIRRATKDDITGLLRLLRQIADLHYAGRPDIFNVGSKKYSASQLELILADANQPVYVAVDGENYIMGYCFCQLKQVNHSVLRGILTLHIDDFCVEERLRGQGIGKQLFKAAEAFARMSGAYNIDLNVWEFNGGAISFYEDLGFDTQRRCMELIL